MQIDLFHGIKHQIDFRLDIRKEYETRVISKEKVLDIGGRNSSSKSRQRINQLNRNTKNTIVSTDIIAAYSPDIVDDICHTTIPDNSFDGIYCDAILEHVAEYWRAIDNIYNILKEDGEAFFFVPFFYMFHDKMDYHRFTFTEVSRMLSRFSETKIFMDSDTGYGGVLWNIILMGYSGKFPRLFKVLYKTTNALLSSALFVLYHLLKKRIVNAYGNITLDDFRFYFMHLYINDGFCSWVRK